MPQPRSRFPRAVVAAIPAGRYNPNNCRQGDGGPTMDIRDYNRRAWDRRGETGDKWTVPGVPDVRPVWRECSRVLRPGGVLLAGFVNPVVYVFDDAAATDRGELVARHAVPYSDLTSLTDAERRRYTDKDEPLVYGHTLEDQL